MEIKYYPEEDVLLIIKSPSGCSGGSLRDDFGVIYTSDNSRHDNVTRVDIHHVSYFLPLRPERGYDAGSDTLTLGDKPDGDYRVVDNGDFVSYRQWFDDGGGWDIVAVDLRRASELLAPALAAHSQPASANAG